MTIDSNDKKDSDNILAQQFSKVIRKMAGQEIFATMSPTGEFTDVKYPEGLEKEMKDLTAGLGVGGGVDWSSLPAAASCCPRKPSKRASRGTTRPR